PSGPPPGPAVAGRARRPRPAVFELLQAAAAGPVARLPDAPGRAGPATRTVDRVVEPQPTDPARFGRRAARVGLDGFPRDAAPTRFRTGKRIPERVRPIESSGQRAVPADDEAGGRPERDPAGQPVGTV